MPEQLLTSESYTADNLFAGDFPRIPKKITLLSGENRSKGALLGKISKAIAAAVADGGNTGNGTVGSSSLGSKAKPGNYSLECIEAPVTQKTVPTTGTANGGNTGNGTMTAVAAGGAALKVGTYLVECVVAASNAGQFKVIDPDGVRLNDAFVGVAYTSNHLNLTLNDGSTDFIVGDKFTVAVTGTGNSGKFKVFTPDGERLNDATVAVAYTSPHVNFTIADGSTDFIVGDKFTIPVNAGSGKYKLSASAAVDGSQELSDCVVLTKDTDASGGDVEALGYMTGEFNENKMTFGTGYAAASTKEALAKKCIFLQTPALTA